MVRYRSSLRIFTTRNRNNSMYRNMYTVHQFNERSWKPPTYDHPAPSDSPQKIDRWMTLHSLVQEIHGIEVSTAAKVNSLKSRNRTETDRFWLFLPNLGVSQNEGSSRKKAIAIGVFWPTSTKNSHESNKFTTFWSDIWRFLLRHS